MVKHLTCAVCLSALCAFGIAFAVAPMGDKPASARSLPTDELPPFGMLDGNGKLIPVPTNFAGPPPGQPEPSAAKSAGPALDIAIEAARAALDACAAQGAKIAVAVVDAAGKPRALLMAEGSEGSVFVAMRKAIATLALGIPSSQIGAKLASDPALLARFTPAMFLSGGALPIFRGETLIGAIASSGAHGTGPIGSQDESCARVGLQKLNALKTQ